MLDHVREIGAYFFAALRGLHGDDPAVRLAGVELELGRGGGVPERLRGHPPQRGALVDIAELQTPRDEILQAPRALLPALLPGYAAAAARSVVWNGIPRSSASSDVSDGLPPAIAAKATQKLIDQADRFGWIKAKLKPPHHPLAGRSGPLRPSAPAAFASGQARTAGQ